MDIYKQMINPEASEHKMVVVGRTVALLSMVVAVIVAKPLLGDLDQAFQYIQEFTGFFTPGIVVIFLLGFFWKKTTATAALAAALGSFFFSLFFFVFWESLPFMDRVGLVFLLCLLLAAVITLVSGGKEQEKAVHLEGLEFKTENSFNIATVGIIIMLVALYTVWW
jgi:SSS family solute:Na+ symporter